MKKRLLMLCTCFALMHGAFASISAGQALPVSVSNPESGDVENNDSPGFGVSIGTVDVQLYSESGLNLDHFYDVEYVAKLSEDVYMGFYRITDSFKDDEGVYHDIDAISFAAFHASDSLSAKVVTIPDSIRINNEVYPVEHIDCTYDLWGNYRKDVKILTVPSSIKYINAENSFGYYLDALYMLGNAPVVYGYNTRVFCDRIYVCNKSSYGSYKDSKAFSESNVLPYGWEFDWVTVHVEKYGEFAETYLTQNNHDWGAVQYLKVTGNINDIDLKAIKNLTSLMKLDLSETAIASLPTSFMQGCTSLLEIKLPATVQRIGERAFSGCSSLQSFDLNGITEIASNAFSNCSSLATINLTGVSVIDSYAFSGCASLNNIDLSTVGFIRNSAFERCTSLEMADLKSAEDVGNDLFRNCTSLKTVKLGERLKSLGYRSFCNTAIDSISLPASLKELASEVFKNCSKLVSVKLPESLSSIGSYAFQGCTSLEEINIPATVKSIGSNAFSDTGIKTFKCYAAVPPQAGSSFVGEGMDMTRTYLYVPPFSKDFYRNTPYWSEFYLMKSIQDPISYISVDRPLTINLEEEDNAVVANNPEIALHHGVNSYGDVYDVGQLTATGTGTLSAGLLRIIATMTHRNNSRYQYCPTLINYADKMRADNISINMGFSEPGTWYFISFPFDVKVSDIVPDDKVYWVIRRYDSEARAAGRTEATWVNLTNEDILEAGKGYILSAVQDGNSTAYVTFTSGNSLTKNNLFCPTDVIVPLTEYPAEFAHNRSWNLIGNPYPCYFDMHHLNEEFTAPVTVWNGYSYVAYSPVDDNLVLSPYESFFVQCPLDMKEMTFKETGRLHSEAGNSLYKSPAMNPEAILAEGRNVFNFELAGEEATDRARIVLNPDATMAYELGRDASKFFADNSCCAQIYVAADVNYSISERPVDNGTATLGIRSAQEEVYTLSLSGKYSTEWQVIVTDNVTGTAVDLTENDYQFTAVKGDSQNRFSVEFRLKAPTGIGSVVSAFGKDAVVTVTAVNGMVVYTGKLSEMKVPAAGLYLISDGKDTRKAIVE